jgi:hypothetical protein
MVSDLSNRLSARGAAEKVAAGGLNALGLTETVWFGSHLSFYGDGWLSFHSVEILDFSAWGSHRVLRVADGC